MKQLNLFILAIFAFCLIILGWIGFLVKSEFFPPNPVKFCAAGIKILTPQVKPKEEFRFMLPVEKYGLYPARISTSLISTDRKKIYAMPPETAALPPGKYNLTVEVIIPAHVDPGEYTMNRIYIYSVGKAEVVKYFETPPFEVIP